MPVSNETSTHPGHARVPHGNMITENDLKILWVARTLTNIDFQHGEDMLNLDRSGIDAEQKQYIEKQLLAKPGIEGTVSIQFFITGAGSVKSSVGAGFDSEVANCVADVVSAIEFPKPPEGGAQVNYPFTFHAAK